MSNGTIYGVGSNIAKVALVTAASWAVEKGIEWGFERARQRHRASAAASASAGDISFASDTDVSAAVDGGKMNSSSKPSGTNRCDSVLNAEPLNISEELSKSREKRQAQAAVFNADGSTSAASTTSLSEFGDDELKNCLSVLSETEFLQLLIACGMQTQATLVPLLPGAIKRCVVRYFSAYSRVTTKLSNVELHHLKQALSSHCTTIGTDLLGIVRERDPALNRDYPLKIIVHEIEKGLNEGIPAVAAVVPTAGVISNAVTATATSAVNNNSSLAPAVTPETNVPAPPGVTATGSGTTNPLSVSPAVTAQETLLSQVLIMCIAFCQDFLWRCSTTIFDITTDRGDDMQEKLDREVCTMLNEFEQVIERKLRSTVLRCGGWNKLSSSTLPYGAIVGGVLGGVLIAFQGFRTLRGGSIV